MKQMGALFLLVKRGCREFLRGEERVSIWGIKRVFRAAIRDSLRALFMVSFFFIYVSLWFLKLYTHGSHDMIFFINEIFF